jgi:hypothetical protein
MKQPVDTEKHAKPSGAGEVVKKPYRKPAVRHEQVFETRALACSKTPGPLCGSTRPYNS